MKFRNLLEELREAQTYYANSKDPNLRQQSDLCKRAADVIGDLRPAAKKHVLKRPVRLCVHCGAVRDFLGGPLLVIVALAFPLVVSVGGCSFAWWWILK